MLITGSKNEATNENVFIRRGDKRVSDKEEVIGDMGKPVERCIQVLFFDMLPLLAKRNS